MTLLPWQHTRNRTKSGSEKSNLAIPQDWFSRTSVEPSRQALADLVKAHNRMGSDESAPRGLRSRTNTINSQRSHKTHSRSGTPDYESWSRPSSQGAGDGPISPISDRTAGSSRSGRLLKRPSSRMSLSSAGSSSTHGLTSPSRSSRVSSSTVRADEIRSKISAPFDFQHITHTEETQFSGLRRIEETALTHQYIAATSVQHPEPALRGIATSDLPAAVAAQQSHTPSPHASVEIPSAIMSELPQTPPRPLPPPKDDVVVEQHPLHSYASADNEPLETTGLAWLSTYSEHSPLDDTDPQITAVETALKLKPLPELPVIHAITTEDETAMAMISSPLPTPPVRDSPMQDNFFSSRPHQHRQQSSLNSSYRNMYPSTKSSMPNLLAVNQTLAAPRTLLRHHSDMALSQQAKSFSSTVSTRTSMSFAAIDTLNWEDAVDEAWDFPEGVDDNSNNTSSFSSYFSDRSQIDTNFLDVPALDSAGSTPLMMTAAAGVPRSPDRASFSHGLESHVLESVKEDEPSTNVTGLGISACPAAGTTPTMPRLSRSSSGQLSRRRSSLSHHANDVLTRSSSQESIILSIASSIIGTQRSSNSSVSAVDLTGAYSGQIRDSANLSFNSSGDGERGEVSTGTARPESGCLPPDILDQLCHFGTGFSTDEDSITEDASPLAPLPSQILRRSAPKLLVPERRSSIVATTVLGEPRKRSSTWGNRSRQVPHGSYSLFPTARQSSCMATPSA